MTALAKKRTVESMKRRLTRWCECGHPKELQYEACSGCMAKDGVVKVKRGPHEPSGRNIALLISAFRTLGGGCYTTEELGEATGLSTRQILRLCKELTEKLPGRSFYLKRYSGEVGGRENGDLKLTKWCFVGV